MQVSGLTNIVAVSAGESHSLAVKADGTAWSWGRNATGQLADGTTTDRNTPAQVPNLTGVSAVSAGSTHSLFLGTTGESKPPSVIGTWPGSGAEERAVRHITVAFSEPVQNVSLDDLSLSVGTVLSVSGSGPYLFEVTGMSCQATATLDGDIVDGSGNDLPVYQWEFGVGTSDTDGDGVPDCADACPDTIAEVGVDPSGCPPLVRADFNRDGDVDADDLILFDTCASAPGVPVSPDCTTYDLDPDNDVDQLDFSLFQRCFSGKNRPANPSCDE